MPREYPRKLRLNAQLQRELTDLIRSELTDPRVKGVTVTQVDTSPDLRQAKVYVSQLALDAQPREAVKALNGAAGLLHRELGHRLRMRYAPHLHFAVDEALAQGDRVGGLIRQVVAEDEQFARQREQPRRGKPGRK